MKTLSSTQARTTLYQVIDDARSSHEPVQITGKRGNVVMLAEEDWNAVQETLYLLSIPGMRDSIRKGMKESVDKCSTTIDL
jgi:PHD/YefM family antitoxin component YafN of YafNO toxin-antitoxin module